MSDAAPILVEGSWISARASATREIRNPATLDLLGRVPDCGADDVAAAVGAAARAQPARVWVMTACRPPGNWTIAEKSSCSSGLSGRWAEAEA